MIRRLSRRTRTAAALTLVLCLGQLLPFFQPALEASERRLEGSVLEIHHRDGQFVDQASKKSASLTEKPTYVLKKGDTVSLVVVDQNPLLFDYAVDRAETETEQHKIAAQFAKSLSDALQPFRNLNAGGAGKNLTVEGLDLTALQSDLAELNDRLVAIPALIAQSIGSDADVTEMKKEVAQWRADELADRLTKSLPKLMAIAQKCAAGRPLSAANGTTVSCLAAFDPEAERHAVDEADRQKAKSGAAAATAPATPAPAPARPTAPTGNAGGRGGPSRPSTTPLSGQPARGSAPPAVSAPVAPAAAAVAAPALTQTIQAFVTLALVLQTRAESSLPVVTGFVTDVAAINTTLALKCKDEPACHYSINDQTITVKVTRSKKYEPFLTPAVKARQEAAAKDYPFMLTPFTPAVIGLAAAFVVLFVRNPTYKAVKSGDQFTIQADDNKLPGGYNVAAMLTITPKPWSEPTFGGHFQLGVSPTKDKVGFYVGGGIHVQEAFTFGAGVALQQVTRLTGSLSEGQTISSADALKTEVLFKPGLYLHITANIK